MVRPARFMTVRQAARIAERIGSIATRQVLVYNWGEPFLNPDIYDILDVFQPAPTYVHTNGNVRIDCRRLALSQTNVTVQLDGVTQATYGQYRVGGRLSKALETLLLLHSMRRLMVSSRAEVGAQFLLFRHNQHELEHFARLMSLLEIPARVKVPHVAFNAAVLPADLDGFKPRGPVTPEVIRACRLAETDCYIMVDGSVVPCCFDYDATFVLGNILEQPFEEIWHGPIRQKFLEQLRSDTPPEFCRTHCLNQFADTYDISVEVVRG